jgi:putative hydrolases of HD superfamily
MMDANRIAGTLAFLHAAENLKNTLRSGRTSGGRPESTAEHTWRLCLMAMVFAPAFPEADIGRLLRICIVHDLGEAINGDIPAPQQGADGTKADAERADLLTLLEPLPEPARGEILALWDEYNAARTLEARLAKAFDKLETIQQHNQGKNPPGFDYAFNLDYGQRYTGFDPTIAAIRAILDADTARNAEANPV